MRVMSRLYCSAIAISLLACGIAGAQEPDRVAELESQLQQALKSIEQLTARVRELEARADGAAPRAPAGAEPAAPTLAAAEDRIAELESDMAQLAAANVARREDIGLPLHGFADVVAGSNNPYTPDLEGAVVGSLDFYLTPHLGERTRALFELNTKVGITGAVVTDLERVQLGYQLGDAGTIWAGRFHTPYGYYNTAFHHGQQIASSLRRARVVEFERTGGIMPAHTVGVWFAGANRSGIGRLYYDFYVGNSQRIGADGFIDTNNAGNTDGELIFGANLGLVPEWTRDSLRFGITAFTAEIPDAVLPSPNRTQVNNLGVYAVYDTDRWENFIEIYGFDNEDLTGGTGRHSSDMGFVQLGYRTGRFTPYARYERASLDQADNYFAAQRFGTSYEREAIGLRYDLDLTSALKLEVAHTRITDRVLNEFEEALVQYAIRF
jgi:hypothetical protein